MAKLGLEEFIAHYSDALPYSIVPNGNGVGAGTPWGNNPSGSALGAVNTNGNGASGSFKVNSWVNYLSSAYGAGVNPAFVGSVTELFPFNFLSTVTGGNVVNGYGNIRGNNGGCFDGVATTAQRVTTGVIVGVKSDSFDVKADNGNVYTVNVAPCTQFNANRAEYVMEVGNKAVVKGIPVKEFVWTGVQATCLG